MRVVLIAVNAASLAIVLMVGLGGVEAASFPGDSPINSGAPTVDVRYYRRHPSYYYRRREDHCYNRDEIRELQRMWPETNWPRSMRCVPYR